jgi:anion-transporting  ArsA/GET3 family ATPase
VSVSQRLAGKSVCVCVGSGGVGKTTTSAAVALGLAARGARVALVTIDPARRLADVLGLDELGDEPHRVSARRFAAAGLPLEGELWAMMLDPKRTFDQLVGRLAPDAAARDDILGNRIYRELSGAVAGSQEFTAIAKLYDLHRSEHFDVVVLDTPPSRNALDFLDAPDRITQFLEGRALRAFMRPTGVAASVVGRGSGAVFGLLRRLTGVDLLQDLSAFFRSLGGIVDGFSERATAVKALLADPATTFLIVSSPAREAVEEAIFFRARLEEAGMPFGGVVVNRVVETPLADADEQQVAASLGALLGPALGAVVAEVAADRARLAVRDREAIARLAEEVGDPDPCVVPDLGPDVRDAAGLVALQRYLFDGR